MTFRAGAYATLRCVSHCIVICTTQAGNSGQKNVATWDEPCTCLLQGKALPRLCEIRLESCVLFTFCGQENAIFSPHILTTWEEPFRDSLYNENQIRHDLQGGAVALHGPGLPAVEQDGQPEPVGGAAAPLMDRARQTPPAEDPAADEVS